jgi:hypothetical protein
MKMKLSKEQKELLASLSTNYKKGLKDPLSSTSSAHDNFAQHDYGNAELNTINPPLNCPKWACIVLPCINHIPSMKLFKTILPSEAEVRLNDKWVCYDATSLNVGDIIRLNAGDIVPADIKLLNLGLDFVDDDEGDNTIAEKVRSGNTDQDLELIVDSSPVDGTLKPQSVTVNLEDGTVDAVEFYAGSLVLQGEGIAVVTKIGADLYLSKLIRDGMWPPQAKSGWEAVKQSYDEHDDGDQGIV